MGLTRDTASKWFGRSARIPDTLTLARIAERCSVRLDWLILGQGTMDGPVPNARTAKEWLLRAVVDDLERRGDKETLRALHGLGDSAGALLRIVVSEAADLPGLLDVKDDFRRE